MYVFVFWELQEQILEGTNLAKGAAACIVDQFHSKKVNSRVADTNIRKLTEFVLSISGCELNKVSFFIWGGLYA